MPDLVTHTVIPWLFQKTRGKGRKLSIFLLGAILPDLLSRSFNYLAVFRFPFVSDFTRSIHSPFIAVLYCYALSFFFQEDFRKEVFRALLAGSFIHLGMDYLQIHTGAGNYPFFPFSRWTQTKGLFWPEDPLYLVPLWVLAWVVVIIISAKKRKGHES